MPRYKFSVLCGTEIDYLEVYELADDERAKVEAFRLIDCFLKEQLVATNDGRQWRVEVTSDVDVEPVMSFKVKAFRVPKTVH